MFSSLRIRLTVLFIGLVVGPLIIVSSILAQRSFQALEQEALVAQSETAELMGTKISAFIQERENELLVLDEILGLESLDIVEQRTLLGTLLSSEQAYQELTLLDNTGQQIIRFSRSEVISDSDLISQADTDAFLIPYRTGETYFSAVRFDDDLQEPIVTISTPITDLRSGDVSMVLVADLRYKTIWNLFATFNYQGQEDVFLIDEQGRVVAHRNPSLVLGNTTFDLPAERGRTSGLSGTDVIYATQRIQFGSQELVVVAERPYAEAANLALTGVIISIIVTGIALVIATILIFLFVRQVVRPIESLSATALKISDGDLSLQAEVSTRDEIGDLARAFNAMTTRLRELIGNLEKNVAELELAQKDNQSLIRQLRESSRFKDEFLAVMSHELRTPLNAIIGFTGILRLSAEPDSQGYHIVQRIRANSERLLALIDDILDLSRIESGRLELVPTPIPIQDMVKTLVSEIQILADEKNIDLSVDISPYVPDIVQLDEDSLRKIMTNLLSNAVKFTDQGSVSLELRQEDHELVIKVSDTGIGIPAHMQEIIFESFRQVDSSKTRAYGGTGLGLSIVRKLCVAMNGRVDVESTVNKGSTFTVNLPLNSEVHKVW
jgi:signal transduction histidine kinase